jgi:hypothetical protein
LLKQEKFIDDIINKTDKIGLIDSLVILTLNNTSIYSLEYIIDSYDIPKEEQERIIEVLNNQIKY